jgi:predicted nucleotidyltransferase
MGRKWSNNPGLQAETQGGELKMSSVAIDLPTEKIADFCQRWQVMEFALFGSVLRDDFRPDSDIDIMVQFHPEAHPTFSSLDQMEAELKTMFHRDIDLITRQGIETSRNYLRRHEILSSAQVIYATGSSIPA